MATGEELLALAGHNHFINSLAYAPDGRTLVSGDGDGVVKIWDVPTGTERAELPKYEEEITALTVSSDGQILAVASGPNVELWDVTKATLIAKAPPHAGKVKCLAFSPDGTLLASGGYDEAVRLWDLSQVTR